MTLVQMIFVAGCCHFGILIASSLVPFRLDWKKELGSLTKLHRQMYWIYGGYVVLSIIAFGFISVCNSPEIAGGSGLARGFSLYVAIFWGIRLSLQVVLDVKEHLTTWWLTLGYHGLSCFFLGFTILYGFAAIHPGP